MLTWSLINVLEMIRLGSNGVVFPACWASRSANLKFNLNRCNHQTIGWQSPFCMNSVIFFCFYFSLEFWLNSCLSCFNNMLHLGAEFVRYLRWNGLVISIFIRDHLISVENMCPHSTTLLCAIKTLDTALYATNIILFSKYCKAYCQKIIWGQFYRTETHAKLMSKLDLQ